MKKFLLLLLLIIFYSNSFPQLSDPPKREFRSAWIATVTNLDWPVRGASAESQKQNLIDILNFLQTTGINNVVFQIRTECDAFYPSPYEPWSYYITGTQGADPGYDPLQFAIDETHKRGMELHAWFNPYRAIKIGSSYPKSDLHVSKQHPDWLIASLSEPGYYFLNPGKQVVRDHVARVIMDVVRRYDVDGIHMDDYFYPYGGITTEDAVTFSEESRGISLVGNWRRDNINILLRQIQDSVQAVKSYVKFGMSPFGIWKNGVPVPGLDAYNQIYCDAMAWLQMGSVDYLTPQLYWSIGSAQDYRKLSAWWADSTAKYSRHFYPGHAPYRITQNDWPASELPNQIRINRGNPKTQGSVFFRAGTMTGKGFNDSLRTDLYRYKALLPVMNWKDQVAPNPVQNLRFEKLSPSEQNALVWDKPSTASDGDSAYRYVVYRFNKSEITQADLDNPANILTIEPKRFSFPPVPEGTGPYFFVVTSLDRNWNESTMSNVYQVGGPEIPVQVSPMNGQSNLEDTVTLRWNTSALASKYFLQVSADPNFGGSFIVSGVEVADTFYIVTGFQGQMTYYWRLSSKNPGGSSLYSQVFSFTTGFPTAPQLLLPAHASLNQPLNLQLVWQKNNLSESYRLQVSTTIDFSVQNTIIDESGLTDTTYSISNLINNKNYYWRVAAVNQYGVSQWSIKFGFRTAPLVGLEDEGSVPTEFKVAQNFPNPFNPSTQISFELPRAGFTTLKIYDAVGNEIADLISEDIPAGRYTVDFNASGLSSGVYFYILRSGDVMISNKMVLMK